MKKQIAISLVLLVLASCGGKQSGSNKSNVIKIDGSGTVALISQGVLDPYKDEENAVAVTIGTSGSGGGFKKFAAGETDINESSRPISQEEDAACKAAGVDYVELPVAYDGLAVVVNMNNDWVSSMTVNDLKKLWEPDAQGKITTWNQINPAWPKEEIHLFGHRTVSGSFDYFTEAINGTAQNCRTDYTAGADSAIVGGVGRDKYALGYLGLAYFENNRDKLKVVPIDNGKGAGAITPTLETVKNGTYQPLSRPLFLYVSKKSLARAEVKAFVDFYLGNAGRIANNVGYVPMPPDVYGMVKARLAAGTTGSLFLGKNLVGVKMEDMLKAEQTSK